MGCALTACWAVGCDPLHTTFAQDEEALRYEAKTLVQAPVDVAKVKIMNWNLRYAGGRLAFFYDCYGDRAVMTRDEVITHLEGLVKKIDQVDPDILVLQEIDIRSKRAAYVDQVQWLLDRTKLNYGVYASVWRADYIPSDGIGRMESGNAILSRWPIAEATRIKLPLIEEQDALTRYFYLRRNMLRTRVELPGRDNFYVVATHLSAYSNDGTKKKQLDLFKGELDRLKRSGALVVGLGDLNTLPPGSTRTKNFPDSRCPKGDTYDADDYSAEQGWLDALYQEYNAAIPLKDYQANNKAYFTYGGDKDGFWSRKLDYIFTNGTFVPGSALTHQEKNSGGMDTLPLSDHAPLTVELEVKP